MSKSIPDKLNYRTLTLAALCITATLVSPGVIQASSARTVYRQQIGNTGEIVFYSSGHYRITNRTSTNLRYRFTIKAGNGAYLSESILYTNRFSSSNFIDCIHAKTVGIRHVEFHQIGPRK